MLGFKFKVGPKYMLLVVLLVLFSVLSVSAQDDYQVIEHDYEKVAENDDLELYLNSENLALKIVDQKTGYEWNSIIEDLEEGENNSSWENFMSSGLALDYFEEGKTSTSRTDLLSDEESQIEVEETKNGFKASVSWGTIDISLDLIVELTGKQLIFEIPGNSIEENGDYRLAGLYLYPFLGSVRQDEKSGYMLVPDGTGGLIDFKSGEGGNQGSYKSKFYGENAGIKNIDRDNEEEEMVNPAYELKFPVYGLAHRENEQAIFSIIEKGQYNSELLARPAGAKTEYNWITPHFIFREQYMQPTSRSMGGIELFESQKNIEDIKIRHNFINGDRADYVGMAHTYQDYLVKEDKLSASNTAEEEEKKADIPLRMDVLGAETEKGLFSPSIVSMTTAGQFKEIVTQLQDKGIDNLVLVYQGWNRGGFSGTKPYEVEFEEALGSKADFNGLFDFLDQSNIPLFFYEDFTIGYNNSPLFSYRRDAARKINNVELEVETNRQIYDKFYYLNLRKTRELINDKKEKYSSTGIKNLAIDSSSYILFSNRYSGEVNHRVETAEEYHRGMENLAHDLEDMALYNPNDYLLEFTEYYLDIPMDSSHYLYFDREAPFVQIVLKGYLEYFAPYVNFFSNQERDVLKLIEYGAYPSFMITNDSAYDLIDTDSRDIFSSSFAEWETEITDVYKKVEQALGPVKGESIEEHREIADDVVHVVYENGVQIYVNYREQDYEVEDEGYQLGPRDYKVVKEGEHDRETEE